MIYKEKTLFWLVVSEVSVHGNLAPLLWTCSKAEHHDGEGILEHSCSPHGMQEPNRRRGCRQDRSFKGTPPATHFLPSGPTFHIFTTFQKFFQL
jgi:hypothetical protein